MNRRCVFTFCGVLVCALACAHVPSPTASNMSCPTAESPQCVAASTEMVTLTPHPRIESTSVPSLAGSCELIVDNRPMPCTGVVLKIQAEDGGETRESTLQGSTFHFDALTRDHYHIEAHHPRYGLLSTQKDDLSPGQTQKLTLRAKTR